MYESLGLIHSENKLNEINKKIIEIKKKIQLSEGQRKANFEEYDAKKYENAQRIGELKKEIKEFYVTYGKVKNNEEVMEHAAQLSRDSAVCKKKRNLEDIIATANENNVHLRKTLDLIKYQRKKHEHALNILQTEKTELMYKCRHCVFKKKTENPMKKRIEKLEVQLEHIRMMQIKTNISRMKYRSICSELKEKSVFYASSLENLEDGIREQENEIKRLQGVKKEAVELRDNTQETLVKEELEEINSSKRRDFTIKEYRQRVTERRMELERLERMIFYTRPHDDFETQGKRRMQDDAMKDELTRLEEAFVKLRNATGVSRSEEVQNRFLAQQATKKSLQKMRTAIEQEKMVLEKKRQELSAEIETRKFSETKSAEQNAELMAQLNSQIDEQQSRVTRSDLANQRVHEILSEITNTIYKLYEKFQRVIDVNSVDKTEMEDPLEIIQLLKDKLKNGFDIPNSLDKHLEIMKDVSLEKSETISVATTTAEGRTIRINGGPLFPRFLTCGTPIAPFSEDEEEIPSRNILKRQAQLLVDIKSRRKGFTFKR